MQHFFTSHKRFFWEYPSKLLTLKSNPTFGDTVPLCHSKLPIAANYSCSIAYVAKSIYLCVLGVQTVSSLCTVCVLSLSRCIPLNVRFCCDTYGVSATCCAICQHVFVLVSILCWGVRDVGRCGFVYIVYIHTNICIYLPPRRWVLSELRDCF
jgi:hypothetical protein